MEVPFKEIKVGGIYSIKDTRNKLNEKHIGKCISMSRNKSSAIFKIKVNYYLNGEKSMDNETMYYDINHTFFILGQKEKIQQSMEERSLNMIIEQILGHPVSF
jgi:hypothetical protein